MDVQVVKHCKTVTVKVPEQQYIITGMYRLSSLSKDFKAGYQSSFNHFPADKKTPRNGSSASVV